MSALIGPNSLWRVRVLAADERAHRPELALKRAERVAEPAHVHQALAHGRNELLVLADQRAVRADVHLRVEHRAQRARQLFAHAHHDVGVRRARRAAQRVDLGAGDLDGVLEQLDRELGRERPGRGVVVVPHRMRGDEALREADHARAFRARLADQPAGLLGGALAVEEHRGRLDRRNLHHRILITHEFLNFP